jgi:hypothetical protein
MAQFNALEDYRAHMEAQIQESPHSTRTQILINSQLPSDAQSEESVQEWLCLRQQEVDECDRRFKVQFCRLLRFSILMSLYTLVESNLSAITGEMKTRKKLPLDMMDLQAKNLVKRFEKFWTKVAGLNWWDDCRWDQLKDIAEVRNCIAHRNGVIRESDGRIRQLLKRECAIQLVDVNDHLADPDDAGTLEVEEGFCKDGIENMKALFCEVFERAGCFGPDHVVLEPD